MPDITKDRLCSCGCGKKARNGGTMSAGCYMAKYRNTPKGKENCRETNRRWRRNNPEKADYHNREYKREYRSRTGHTTHPDVRELRRAVKRLERALAEANNNQGVGG